MGKRVVTSQLKTGCLFNNFISLDETVWNVEDATMKFRHKLERK